MDIRVAKCVLLSKVLAADGMITENERAMLEGAMRRERLTDAERKVVHDLEGWAAAESAVAGLPEDERRAVLDELLGAASADGRLSPLEAAALTQISAVLGL
jgi:uncharacterized tellurite resistance protein B-like protein